MKSLSLLILLATLTSSICQAKLFKNSFVSFELPSNWSCQLTNYTWNCSNQFEKKVKSAVIVLAAKEVGPQDTLKNYEKEISSKPGITISGTKHFKAKKLQIKKNNINQQVWIDGLSYNSEAPDFYTRYLATTKNKIAILVTFTSHKSYYTSYVTDFLKAIKSLKILSPENKPKIIKPKVTNYQESKQDNIIVDDNFEPEIIETEAETLFTKQNIGLFLMVVTVIFLLFKF